MKSKIGQVESEENSFFFLSLQCIAVFQLQIEIYRRAFPKVFLEKLLIHFFSMQNVNRLFASADTVVPMESLLF